MLCWCLVLMVNRDRRIVGSISVFSHFASFFAEQIELRAIQCYQLLYLNNEANISFPLFPCTLHMVLLASK